MKQFFVSVIIVLLSQSSLLAWPLRAEMPFTLSITVDAYNPGCQKNNGKIFVRAGGGQPPYHYTCGSYGPNTSGNFIHLPPGNYLVTATDANGMNASQAVSLVNINDAPVPVLLGTTNPSGCTTNDGVINLGATGGQAPYTYSLDNINYQAGAAFFNLSAGNYMYAVKDANGCSSFPSLLTYLIGLTSGCPLKCLGMDVLISCNPYKQHIFLNNINGGTAPYQFSKDGIHFQSNNDFDSLEEGYHRFWILDAAGLLATCDLSGMDNCDKGFPIGCSVTAARCGPNGTITVTATEGVAPYLFSIDGQNFQAGNVFAGLAAGNYVVTVRDAYGIESTKLVTIYETCLAMLLSSHTASCGKSNGSIHVQAYSGQPPYLYSADGNLYNPLPDFTALQAGTYHIYVKDASGMIISDQVQVSNVPGPVTDSVVVSPTGCDNHSGTLTIYASAGSAPLVYWLDNGLPQNHPDFTGLSANSYKAIVMDANGCSDTAAINIIMDSKLPVVNLGVDTVLCDGEKITLQAGNTSGQVYQWQDGSTASSFTVEQAGRYHVLVTRQGCEARDTIEIRYLSPPALDLGPDLSLCKGVPYMIAPHIRDVNYRWQDGSTDSVYKVTAPGLYTLTVNNRCGTARDAISFQAAICDIYVPNAFTPDNDGKNDYFRIGYGENITRFEMRIFNRYGKCIFLTTDKARCWDGRFRSQLQPAGTYSWFIRYQTSTAPVWQEIQGSLLLLL